jgi:hypothetical protein
MYIKVNDMYFHIKVKTIIAQNLSSGQTAFDITSFDGFMS